MIEAVENHMPEVIVIDEIGTELEALAARTIAERGVQLIGTAHGNNLDNLMLNPTLSDLIGGIQTVTLGDDEARRRRTQKTVLERKAPPTFDVVVEIADRDRVAVHADVAETVDALLRGDPLAPEMRWRDEGGVHRSQARPRPGPRSRLPGERFGGLVGGGLGGWDVEPGWRPDLPARAASPGPVPRRRGAAAGSACRVPAVAAGSRSPVTVRRPRRAADRDARMACSVPEALPTAGRSSAAPCPSSRAPARAVSTSGRRSGAPRPAAPSSDPAGHRARHGPPASLPTGAIEDEEAILIRLSEREDALPLEPLSVLGYGVSRKRLEQAIRRPAAAGLRRPRAGRGRPRHHAAERLQAEDAHPPRGGGPRGLPIYVLKSNTVAQMQAILTSLYALETDPQRLAMRELEEAIGLVRAEAQAGRAVTAERLRAQAAAPCRGGRQPRVPVSRSRALPPGQGLPREGPRLALRRPRT